MFLAFGISFLDLISQNISWTRLILLFLVWSFTQS